MPITTGSIKGEESSTTTFKVRTVSINQNSTVMQQEILTVGDPQTSNALARVVAAAPVSTEFGLIVRIASGPSSAADLPVQISGNSTAIIQGNSTVIQGTSPWIIGGNSTVIQGTSPWVVSATRINIGSTAADNAVVISGNSTAVIQGNSTVIQGTSPWIIGGNSTVIQGTSPWVISGNSTVIQGTSPWVVADVMQSSVAPSSGSSGVIVRPVIDNILTTASTNAMAGSTAFSIQSSAAGIRSYVTAYSITSTAQALTKLAFMSGSTMIWPVALAALSSAFAGVNLAVSAPAYLFRTKTAGPLTLNTGGSTLVGFKVGVSYFRAP